MTNPLHGHASRTNKSPTYQSWNGMRGRCYSPGNGSYKNYGARGILVCDRWATFENFLADMGERPKGFTLERMDVNGNYTKENCKWIRRSEQALNRRNSRFYEVNGVRMNVKFIEQELGLSQGAVYHRIRSGWTVEKAISTRVISAGGKRP